MCDIIYGIVFVQRVHSPFTFLQHIDKLHEVIGRRGCSKCGHGQKFLCALTVLHQIHGSATEGERGCI